MPGIIDLIINYNDLKKLIVYEKETSLVDFHQLLQKEFQILKSIKLCDPENNGEVTNVKSFKAQRKLSIHVIEDAPEDITGINESIPEQNDHNLDESLFEEIRSNNF